MSILSTRGVQPGLKKPSISIVLPSLCGGGAERLAIYLANDWAARGFSVEFLLLNEAGELLGLVSPAIRVTGLNSSRIKHAILPLRLHLKQSQPDVLWVGMWPLTSAAVVAWLLAGRIGKIFLTDHIHLSISCVRELHLSPLWLKALMTVTYPLATGVTAVSKGVANDMVRLSGILQGRIKVIYNPAATGASSKPGLPTERQQLWGDGFDFHILTVGSFKIQKNHALLLRAFSKMPRTINAKLTILGEGDLRPDLEMQVAELGLQDRVGLPGFFTDPYPWFRSADLFVLSSDWEGFANVIVEAMECGVPVVSTDCPSGPAEILENGRYGRLVPVGNADALSCAMIASLMEVPDRESLMNRAKDFSVKRISNDYLDCFGLPRHA